MSAGIAGRKAKVGFAYRTNLRRTRKGLKANHSENEGLVAFLICSSCLSEFVAYMINLIGRIRIPKYQLWSFQAATCPELKR